MAIYSILLYLRLDKWSCISTLTTVTVEDCKLRLCCITITFAFEWHCNLNESLFTATWLPLVQTGHHFPYQWKGFLNELSDTQWLHLSLYMHWNDNVWWDLDHQPLGHTQNILWSRYSPMGLKWFSDKKKVNVQANFIFRIKDYDLSYN